MVILLFTVFRLPPPRLVVELFRILDTLLVLVLSLVTLFAPPFKVGRELEFFGRVLSRVFIEGLEEGRVVGLVVGLVAGLVEGLDGGLLICLDGACRVVAGLAPALPAPALILCAWAKSEMNIIPINPKPRIKNLMLNFSIAQFR